MVPQAAIRAKDWTSITQLAAETQGLAAKRAVARSHYMRSIIAFSVALGRIAAQTLLKTDKSMSRLRGEWHQYQGIPLRATFHPAYLLRKPDDKRLAWDDVKEVLRFLRGEVTLP